MLESDSYAGSELEIFKHATNWKTYWASQIEPYLYGSVLEVGAGLGSNTLNLYTRSQHWTALEPDPYLSNIISKRVHDLQLENIVVRTGYLSSLPPESKYDAILYIDVLEHISSDSSELLAAFHHLSPGGYLIVLSPAHQFLYSPFDASIGHFRRYSRNSLNRLRPADSILVRSHYLDSIGLFASLANKILLRSPTPNLSQIKFWDLILIPISRLIDPLIRFNIGKTVLCVWTKPYSPGHSSPSSFSLTS